MMQTRLFLKHFRYIFIQIGAAAVSSRQLVVEAAAKVADVWLGGDEEDGHLEGAALDDDEADDVALLLGHCLVGLVPGILLQEGGEELRMLAVDLGAEGLPLLGRRVGILGRQVVEAAGDVGVEDIVLRLTPK